MKQLFLLRHAHATSSAPDFDRVLNKEGILKCEQLKLILEPLSEEIDLILCSSSVRTSQTIRNSLPSNPVHYSRDFYNCSSESLLNKLQEANPKHNSILLVGHNPAITMLASSLANEPLDFNPGSLALYNCNIKGWNELDSETTKLISFWP